MWCNVSHRHCDFDAATEPNVFRDSVKQKLWLKIVDVNFFNINAADDTMRRVKDVTGYKTKPRGQRSQNVFGAESYELATILIVWKILI